MRAGTVVPATAVSPPGSYLPCTPLNEGRDHSPGDSPFVVWWARSDGRYRRRVTDSRILLVLGGNGPCK